MENQKLSLSGRKFCDMLNRLGAIDILSILFNMW